MITKIWVVCELTEEMAMTPHAKVEYDGFFKVLKDDDVWNKNDRFPGNFRMLYSSKFYIASAGRLEVL